MQIHVKLFGPAALAQGQADIPLDLDASTPLRDRSVLGAIADQYPTLATFTTNGRLAVNGQYAVGELAISPQDEVALIALVSGG
jgi:molybdopterin converting factor small subunit